MMAARRTCANSAENGGRRMRDLFFVAFLGAMFLLGLRRPFLLVLGYIYVDIVSPQNLSYYLLNSIPVSLIFFLGAVGGWLIFDRKQGLAFGPRQGAMLVLLIYCFFTTGNADFPVEAGTKWDWVWKVLVFAIFLPIVLGGYWMLRGHKRQNLLLLIASYVFYGAWDWRFLGLIAVSTAIDYWSARAIEGGAPERRERWLALSVCANLGVLAFFKYFNFKYF